MFYNNKDVSITLTVLRDLLVPGEGEPSDESSNLLDGLSAKLCGDEDEDELDNDFSCDFEWESDKGVVVAGFFCDDVKDKDELDGCSCFEKEVDGCGGKDGGELNCFDGSCNDWDICKFSNT